MRITCGNHARGFPFFVEPATVATRPPPQFARGPAMRKPFPLTAGILAAVLVGGAAGVAIGASSRAGPSLTNLALLNGVIELVQRDYVKPVGADELTKDALKGMLSRLDPHSDYMDETEFKESQNDLSG